MSDETETTPTEAPESPPPRLTIDEVWKAIQELLAANGYKMAAFAVGNTSRQPSDLSDFTGYTHRAQILIFEPRQ